MSRKLAIVALAWSVLNLLVWITATAIVQSSKHLQHSISYLTFVSNYALVSSSFGGVVSALAALWSEGS